MIFFFFFFSEGYFIYLFYKITLFTPFTLQYSIYSALFTSLKYKKKKKKKKKKRNEMNM